MALQVTNGIGQFRLRNSSNQNQVSLDTDAQAFITAAGITDTTQVNAVKELVLDLKSANLWTKMKAVYPMVGGTATSHKFNLKDPRDLDAAFRLTFYGGWTHSSTGIQGNGSTAYASTNMAPLGNLNQNDNHYTIYSRTQTTSTTIMTELMADSSNSTYSNPWGHYTNYSGSVSYGVRVSPYNSTKHVSNYSSNEISDFGTVTRGLIGNSRQSSSQFSVYRNGSYMQWYNSFWRDAIYNATSNALTSKPIQIGAWGSTGSFPTFGANFVYFSSREYAFLTIGDGVSSLEMTILYRIIEKFQAALGRNVNATLPFYYNNSYDLNTNLFFFNAGITNATQQSAVGTLVSTLKNAGIWSKMKAVYPFVGGTATAHKFNLVNPSDTDAAYRLMFNGGGTHSATGYNPGGVNGYADTRLLPHTILNSSSYHISYYSRNNIIGDVIKYVMGSTDLTGKGVEIQSWAYPATAQYYDMYPSSTLLRTGPLTNSKGLIMMDRQTSSLAKAIINGSVLSSNSSASTTLPNTLNGYIPYIWVGSSYRATVGDRRYGNIECAFASIGDGLTDAEATTFYNAVQAFQTTLGRQV